MKVSDPVYESLFAKVTDRFFLCETRHTPAFTDFYDPVKWTAFLNAIQSKYKSENILALTYGGAADNERRMLGFFPFTGTNRLTDFPIKRLRISHNSKFNKRPRHQDYLGSVLGLGLDRGKIGDILLMPETGYADIFVYEDIAGYICGQLEKVGKVPVKVQETFEEDNVTAPTTESQINIASLRLDVTAAAIFRLSRGKTADLISAEKVFVNWTPCTDKGKQIKPGDMVTVRGYGRVQIGEVLGNTKKGRLRVQVVLWGV